MELVKEKERATVTIDEEEYIFDDLPEALQHCLVQIQEVRVLTDTASLEVQRYEMMQRGYVADLADQMDAYKSATEQ
jgi:hypothetical protein